MTKSKSRLKGRQSLALKKYDRVLISVGRSPSTRNIGLENLPGIQTDQRGFIAHNDNLQTGVENIYVIGDAAGEPMLAHKGKSRGTPCCRSHLGHATTFDKRAIPAVVFTDPEIAWAGLTAEEAKQMESLIKLLLIHGPPAVVPRHLDAPKE